MTTPLATLAALDTRVESIIRAHGPCRLGEVAKHPAASGFGYNQVMYSLKRLHASGRVHTSGPAKNRMYMLAPGSERMTPVASEPKLGDRVWAIWFDKLVYGEFISVKEFVGGGKIYEVRPARSATVEVESIALDGCRLIREIEQEEAK